MINGGEGNTSYLLSPRFSYRVLVRNMFLLLINRAVVTRRCLCCRSVDD